MILSPAVESPAEVNGLLAGEISKPGQHRKPTMARRPRTGSELK
jgi:hypothetical protein